LLPLLLQVQLRLQLLLAGTARAVCNLIVRCQWQAGWLLVRVLTNLHAVVAPAVMLLLATAFVWRCCH
jgi:hypothetical protein